MDDVYVETSRCVTDLRGKLYPIEFGELPFKPKRIFLVYDVPAGTIRGEHAHHATKQLLYCVKGKIEVTLENLNGDIVSHIVSQGDFIFVNNLVWDGQKFLTGMYMFVVIYYT